MSVISADRVPAHWRTGRPAPKPAVNPFARTPLAQFILLSMLLHALMIALFGAPSGGSREGRAMWGSLSVTLAPAPPVFSPPTPVPPRPKAEVAPKVEKAAPIEIPQLLDRIAPPTMQSPALQIPPSLEVPIAVPRLLDRLRTPDSPPAELKVPPALEVPIVVPTSIERVKTPGASRTELKVPPALEVPVVVPAPIDSVKAPEPLKELAPAMELPPPAQKTPVEIPALPIPPLTPPVLQQPIEAPVIPALAPKTPPVTAPVEKPAPVESNAIPAPPVTLPAEKSPVESKAIPAPPVAAPVERSPIESRAIPSQAPIERKDTMPPDATKMESVPPREQPPTTNSPSPDLRTSPGPSAPGASPFRTAPREPRGNDYDPTKPSLDIDAAKKRAGELAREGTGQRALFATPLPKPRNKMEDAIEKARKPDCRTAYQDMGLLAIVPLVANEFGEGRCRW